MVQERYTGGRHAGGPDCDGGDLDLEYGYGGPGKQMRTIAGSRGPVDMGLDYGGGSTGRWFYDYRDLTPLFTKKERMVSA